MQPQVVFIASLGHSGSTLLSLCLAGNDQIVSLGEAVRTVELIQQATTATGVASFENRVCTCGRDATDCPVWGQVYTAFQSGEWSGTSEGYEYLLDTADSHHDSSPIVVDSSKGMSNLEIVSTGVGGRVAPLYLVRDVRGWVDSQQRKFRGGNKWGGIRQYLLHTTPGAVLRWYKLNTEMKEALSDYDYYQIGYEEICLQTEQILRAISDWLDIGFDQEMITPTSSGNHLIRGNSIKDDSMPCFASG